jgi:hypothetical protein
MQAAVSDRQYEIQTQRREVSAAGPISTTWSHIIIACPILGSKLCALSLVKVERLISGIKQQAFVSAVGAKLLSAGPPVS